MKKITSFCISICILLGMCTVPVFANNNSFVGNMVKDYYSITQEYDEYVANEYGEFAYSSAYIYDINKDGIPELIINNQSLPSVSYIYVYTYDSTGPVYLGEVSGGRVRFFGYSGNGFMVSYTMDLIGDMVLYSIYGDEICETDTWEIYNDFYKYENAELDGVGNWISVRNAVYNQYNANKQQGIKVILDGEEIYFDQPPIIENERTLVPMRAIFEAMGCDVYWDDGMIDVYEDGENIMSLWINDNEMWLPTGFEYLDVPPRLVNNRTLVPVRVVTESLGAYVEWDGDTRTVYIVNF